jgi:hypothetical protein
MFFMDGQSNHSPQIKSFSPQRTQRETRKDRQEMPNWEEIAFLRVLCGSFALFAV